MVTLQGEILILESQTLRKLHRLVLLRFRISSCAVNINRFFQGPLSGYLFFLDKRFQVLLEFPVGI